MISICRKAPDTRVTLFRTWAAANFGAQNQVLELNLVGRHWALKSNLNLIYLIEERKNKIIFLSDFCRTHN